MITVHEPFSDSLNVRLLSLRPEYSITTVSGELVLADTMSAHFRALVCIWGEESLSRLICLNGKEFLRRENLYNFLRRAAVRQKQSSYGLMPFICTPVKSQ